MTEDRFSELMRNVLEQDVAEWESMERATGSNPADLDYPPDIGERIEQLGEDGDREGVITWKIVERPDSCDCHPDGAGC